MPMIALSKPSASNLPSCDNKSDKARTGRPGGRRGHSRSRPRILDREIRSKLRLVINATGVVLHTNLGRAPMAEAAVQAACNAAKVIPT